MAWMATSIKTRLKEPVVARKVKVEPDKAKTLIIKAVKAPGIEARLKERKILVPVGKNGGYVVDFHKLETALHKDSKLAIALYTKIGEIASKEGVITANINPTMAGKIIARTGIRAGKIEQNIIGVGMTPIVSNVLKRLSEFGDDLAYRYTGGNFIQFLYKYKTDSNFREMVNRYVATNAQNVIPGAKGIDPGQLVEAVVSAKKLTYGRGAMFREALKPLTVEGVKGMAKATTQTGLATTNFATITTSMTIIGTLAPNAGSAVWSLMETTALFRSQLQNPYLTQMAINDAERSMQR